MDQQDLYQIYSKWTGALHFYSVRDLGEHLDCEYFPDTYEFKVYSGYADEFTSQGGIPGLSRPVGERSETIKLLRAEDHPTRQDLDTLFKQICLAAARVLQLKVGPKLKDSDPWTDKKELSRIKDGTPRS